MGVGCGQDTPTLRPFQPEDLRLIDEWAEAYELDKYLSRLRPRRPCSVRHDPRNGLFWFVIVCSGVDAGTIWLEPGDEPGDAVLGIYLKDDSFFGRGIGAEAIRQTLEERRRWDPAGVISLNVRQENTRAIACYAKAGFTTSSSGVKILPSGAQLHYDRMELVLGENRRDDALYQ